MHKFIKVVDFLLALFIAAGAIFLTFFSVAALLLISMVRSIWHS